MVNFVVPALLWIILELPGLIRHQCPGFWHCPKHGHWPQYGPVLGRGTGGRGGLCDLPESPTIPGTSGRLLLSFGLHRTREPPGRIPVLMCFSGCCFPRDNLGPPAPTLPLAFPHLDFLPLPRPGPTSLSAPLEGEDSGAAYKLVPLFGLDPSLLSAGLFSAPIPTGWLHLRNYFRLFGYPEYMWRELLIPLDWTESAFDSCQIQEWSSLPLFCFSGHGLPRHGPGRQTKLGFDLGPPGQWHCLLEGAAPRDVISLINSINPIPPGLTMFVLWYAFVYCLLSACSAPLAACNMQQ